jgi:hypothetical protein
MTPEEFQHARLRADAKLTYARIHLEVLQANGGNGGTDFDRALQESFLFHLLGAKEALLQELNAYYAIFLEPSSVAAGILQEKIKERGPRSEELAELYALEQDEGSWLNHAKQMRDHCTHVAGLARAYHLGGPHHQKVFLKNPKTGKDYETHVLEAFQQWLQQMTELLERMRTSAIARNAV